MRQQRIKIICFNCKQRGHISYNCSERAGLCGLNGRGSRRLDGYVGEVKVTEILLDTGCTQTMVRKDLILPEQLIEGEAATIRCVHGDNVLYPLAEVAIEVEGLDLTVRAAISETLPMSVLLGTDVPQLGQLLHSNPALVHSRGVEHALITTRAQAKKRAEENESQKGRVLAKTIELGGFRDVGVRDVEGRGCGGREEEVRKGDGGEDRVVGWTKVMVVRVW